jgi:hypothetical protein
MNGAAGAANQPLGLWRTLSTGTLLAAAAVSVIALFSIPLDDLGWDFRHAYLRAAEHVVNGESPYPPLDDRILGSGTAYVYPPQLAVVLAPLSLLPQDLVVILAFAGALAALLATPAVLGVRDLRCYAAMLLWAPVFTALETTNITPYLVLAVACMWRYRATVWPLAATLGLAVATKLFLWPLVVWALVTKRTGAALRALALGGAVALLSWAVIGFADLTRYPELLARFSEVQGETDSYSVPAIVAAAGGTTLAGQVITVLVGGALLAAAVYFGRWAADEERSFVAAIGAALLLTPVAWLHYYALLAVPLAIARPRFSALWLLPIVLWACPRFDNGDAQVVLPTLVAVAVIMSLLARPRTRPGWQVAVAEPARNAA